MDETVHSNVLQQTPRVGLGKSRGSSLALSAKQQLGDSKFVKKKDVGDYGGK